MKQIILLFSVLFLSYQSNAQYCNTSEPASVNDEEIFNFKLGSINNTTGCINSTVGDQCSGTGTLKKYANFTSCSTPLFAGSIYTFSVTVNTCNILNYNSAVKIYIDYNQDLDFTDPGEEVFFSGFGVNITCVPATVVTGSFIVPLNATAGTTRLRVIDQENGQSTFSPITPCGAYGYGETEDYSVSIIPPTPCSGVPNAGAINMPDTVVICPTATLSMCDTGSSVGSNYLYNWLFSTNNGATWDTIAGATNFCYTIPAGSLSALYKFSSLCTNSYDSDTTDAIYVSVNQPTYASIPYTQDFETWVDYCDNNDVPNDNHWKNSPSTTDNSWRRNDEGNTAQWSFPNNGIYSPVSSTSLHSARFHSYYANFLGGNFDLFLDLSSATGNKEVLFDFKLPLAGNQLTVSLSNNGGTTFNTLAVFSNISNWATQLITLASSSPTAILRFNCSSNNFISDLGIDNIRVVPQCIGAPTAGTLANTIVCPNANFTLTTVGSSLAAGLSYEWQSSPNISGPWTVVGITSLNSFTTSINSPTYFRCKVTCIGSGISDFTNVQFTDLNTWYYCYCGNTPTNTFENFDMGCVQLLKPTGPSTFLTLINNLPLGPLDTFNNVNAVNGYTNYQFNLPIEKIYRDSLYEARLTAITQSTWSPSGTSVMYIDYNRNGIFDQSEQVGGNAMNISNNQVEFQFTVPQTAVPGITGMRVITANVNGPSNIFNACANIGSGEVEDYLLEITLPPCSAPLNAGIAHISDTLLCIGYPISLYDTTHTNVNNFVGLTMQWQESSNGTTWTNIAGANQDSLFTIVNGKTYYRLKLRCNFGPDSVYSNVKVVNTLPSYACYPASGSFGGINDSSDNGYFTIGTYNFSSGGATGPHLGNPAATRKRTDFTNLSVVELYADSTYNISFYNILRPYIHADAKITFFIDYNNNNQYDIPSERIYTGLSTATSFYLPASFKTIANPAFGVPTGMRLILNNNTVGNNASDLGVGLYTSGETEDFLVKFIAKPTALKDVTNMQKIQVYPNPTNGVVFIDLEANNLETLKVIVTTVAGAEVYSQTYNNVNGNFSTSMNLGTLAKGVYMVKLQSEKGTMVQKITIQ